MKKVLATLYVLLLVILPCSRATADTDWTKDYPLIEDTAAPGAPTLFSVDLGPADLEVVFHEALREFQADNFSEGGAMLDSLASLAAALGYSNVPTYSMRLLDHARLYAARGEQSKSTFFARWALSLSPSDSRVYLSASGLVSEVGWSTAARWFWEGVKRVPSQPTAAVPLLLNVYVVCLTAMTLAFVVLCVVQLVTNSKEVLYWVSRRLPLAIRGLFGPVLFFSLMVVPIFGGLFVALAVWSLMLSCYVKSARWLATLSGLLFLTWWLSIPVMSAVSSQIKYDMNRTFERVRLGMFDARDTERLEIAALSNPADPLPLFDLAVSELRRGNAEAAKLVFSKT
ncbi:MAG: hypothetical protein KDD44_15160, partial [Bdellovibrionales bacterium]|nr:hypothetical protein [Bdellovibrionales bacterium]